MVEAVYGQAEVSLPESHPSSLRAFARQYGKPVQNSQALFVFSFIAKHVRIPEANLVIVLVLRQVLLSNCLGIAQTPGRHIVIDESVSCPPAFLRFLCFQQVSQFFLARFQQSPAQIEWGIFRITAIFQQNQGLCLVLASPMNQRFVIFIFPTWLDILRPSQGLKRRRPEWEHEFRRPLLRLLQCRQGGRLISGNMFHVCQPVIRYRVVAHEAKELFGLPGASDLLIPFLQFQDFLSLELSGQ